MASDKNLEIAKELAKSRADGRIAVPELAMTFTPFEYAQLLDSQELGKLQDERDRLVKEKEARNNPQVEDNSQELLNDARVRKLFKLDDPKKEEE